jgi:acyl-ACP thioesterase
MSDAFRPLPAAGRVFATRRTVRMADAAPGGRLRLDALARFFQEVAEDDVDDSGWREPVGWLVRSYSMYAARYPSLGDELELHTFCSGTGPSWAERTTTVSTTAGPAIQGRAVWVAVDPASGRVMRLGPGFTDRYGASASGRRVSARLTHASSPDGSEVVHPWPLRAADLDAWGHANNVVHWAAVEDVLAATGAVPYRVDVEYRQAVRPEDDLTLRYRTERQLVRMWLTSGDATRASAVVMDGRVKGG